MIGNQGDIVQELIILTRGLIKIITIENIDRNSTKGNIIFLFEKIHIYKSTKSANRSVEINKINAIFC